MYGTMIGAEVMYVRSRNPRVIFEALRELRVNTMIVTPQLIELFWAAVMREVDKQGKRATFERARKIARRLPYRRPARCCSARIHKQLGGEFRLFVSAGRVSAAGAPALVGGPGRRGAAGLRRHGMRTGVGQHGAPPPGGRAWASPSRPSS